MQIGYPVLVRPSFVLGGRAMEIVSDEDQLNYYMAHAVEASGESPILVDKFLDVATEVDVDCVADFDAKGTRGQAVIAGVMEHIEEAGSPQRRLGVRALPPLFAFPGHYRRAQDPDSLAGQGPARLRLDECALCHS